MSPRLAERETPALTASPFASHVFQGLSDTQQKWLSAQYFYDAVGSALFEAITALPEYGLTRADARLLSLHAPEIMGESVEPLRMIELGSGSGNKTRWLLESAVAVAGSVRYSPIDVSQSALDYCRAILGSIDGVQIQTFNATYLEALPRALANRRVNERVLVLFLGSTIGNFEEGRAVSFLQDVRRLLEPGDQLLLGTDLVKPVEQLLPAYDDAAGVTAAFNRNLLSRINHELGGDFDVRSFEHEVRWNRQHARVEMHLRSDCRQSVRIEILDRAFDFEAGETIWTESSHKFTPERVRRLARSAGFLLAGQWLDEEWPFAESLLVAG